LDKKYLCISQIISYFFEKIYKLNMSVAFWSAEIKAGKPVEVQPPEGYVLNLQQAALAEGKTDASVIVKATTTGIDGDKLTAVLCTLRKNTCDQVGLQLVFGFDAPVQFSLDGSGSVHISGYYQPGPEMDGDDDDMDDYDEDVESEDDEDDEDDEIELKKSVDKKLANIAASKIQNKKVEESDEDDDDEDDDEDDDDSEEDGIDAKFIQVPNLVLSINQ
jgi:hypothetical protein